MASSPVPRHTAFDPGQTRIWLLLLSAPVGYVAGATIRYDHGLAAGMAAAAIYMTVIGGFAIFGARSRHWLRAHAAVSAVLFGALAFVTLLGLHIFTPAEDAVVAVAAGLAAAALNAES